MPKISVLTPLYNTEPDQLKEMIESVLAQSFSDFEFLLLNDSPDNTELESLVKGSLSVKITFATLSVLHGVVKHAIFAGVYR